MEQWKRTRIRGMMAPPTSEEPENSAGLPPWREGALLDDLAPQRPRPSFVPRHGRGAPHPPAEPSGPDSGAPGTLWHALWRVKRVFCEASGRDASASATDFGAQLSEFQDVVRATRTHRGNAAELPTAGAGEAALGAMGQGQSTAQAAALGAPAAGAGDALDVKPSPDSTTTPRPPPPPAAAVPARLLGMPQDARPSPVAAPLSQLVRDAASDASCTGAILLAVCRGKAAEGIDFSDDFARTVVGACGHAAPRRPPVGPSPPPSLARRCSGRHPLPRAQ